MKNAEQNFAKIKVLSCEQRLNRDSGRQDFDKEGNPLWTVQALDLSYNEEFKIMEQKVTKYKSITEIDPGDHIVNFKATYMGEGNGSFIKINTFYTILKTVSPKATIDSLFNETLTNPDLSNKQKLKESGKQASLQ